MAQKQASAQRTATKNPRAQYTKEEKIKAVSILAAMGGLSRESQKQVELQLNKPVRYYTLAHWQTDLKSLVVKVDLNLEKPKELDVAKLVAETRQKLVTNLASTAIKASAHLNKDSVIDATSGRDAAVIVGIASEKMLLMNDHDPHGAELFNQLKQACVGSRFEPYTFMQDAIAAIERSKQMPTPQIKDDNSDKLDYRNKTDET